MSEQNEECREGPRVSCEARGAPIRPRRKRLGKLRRRFGTGGGDSELISYTQQFTFSYNQKYINIHSFVLKISIKKAKIISQKQLTITCKHCRSHTQIS